MIDWSTDRLFLLLGYQNECILAKDDMIGLMEQREVVQMDIKRANCLIASFDCGQMSSHQVLNKWRKQEAMRTIGEKYAILVSLFAFTPKKRKARRQGGTASDGEPEGYEKGRGTGGHQSSSAQGGEKIRCTLMFKVIYICVLTQICVKICDLKKKF